MRVNVREAGLRSSLSLINIHINENLHRYYYTVANIVQRYPIEASLVQSNESLLSSPINTWKRKTSAVPATATYYQKHIDRNTTSCHINSDYCNFG